jgi:hypothetical protein
MLPVSNVPCFPTVTFSELPHLMASVLEVPKAVRLSSVNSCHAAVKKSRKEAATRGRDRIQFCQTPFDIVAVQMGKQRLRQRVAPPARELIEFKRIL